jgi:hypothetical protein
VATGNVMALVVLDIDPDAAAVPKVMACLAYAEADVIS